MTNISYDFFIDFFRFDMLENGDYPSFDEIGHMIQSEFDFESYEESTIAPFMYGYSSY
jgi:hypothetical protein